MATLIIAEKNSAAKAIAEALGESKIIKKKSISIYHVHAKDIYVIPLRGHLLEYKNTSEFKSWTKSSPRAIIINPNAIKKTPKNYARPYIDALIEYGKQCVNIVIATDADAEGCNIGLFDAFPFVKKGNSNILLSQMWLSTLQKSEILQKFNSPIAPKWSWGESAEARAVIDAVIGFSATREVTNSLRSILNYFDVKFISIGRVQTSLLYLIYLRENRIKDFNPEHYFTLEADLSYQNTQIKANHTSNPFRKENESIAQEIFRKIKDEKHAKIIDNTRKKKLKKPPIPLNTSSALVLLTSILKVNANQAFNAMNSLYLNKIISYPRTDSDVYKANFDHAQYLEKFTSHADYGEYAIELIKESRMEPTRGKKDAGDHPPITPLVSLDRNSAKFESEIQKKVYDVLVRHYLALFGKEATESNTVLKLSIGGEYFISRLVSLHSEGFLKIVPFLKPYYDQVINIVGDTIPVKKVLFIKRETKPPPAYNDTSLLKLMEKNRLGTKSTRPVIIKLLLDRKFIHRVKRKYLITKLGFFLIDSLKEVWLPFLEPNFTKKIEEQLEDIKNERKSREKVIQDVKDEFLKLFDRFIEKKDDLMSYTNIIHQKLDSISQNKQPSKSFLITTSMCPYCKTSPMKFITSFKNKKFLKCSNQECNHFLSLPQRGALKILKSTCSLCGFNVFSVRTRKINKYFTYYLCPKCWNEGLMNKSGKGFCSKCESYKIVENQCIKKTKLNLKNDHIIIKK